MAARYPLTIKCGVTWPLHLELRDETEDGALQDLSGFTGIMQIKDANGTVIVTLSTANGGMVLGGALGTIDCELAAEASRAFTVTSGEYDLLLISSQGKVYDYLEGPVTFTRAVSTP